MRTLAEQLAPLKQAIQTAGLRAEIRSHGKMRARSPQTWTNRRPVVPTQPALPAGPTAGARPALQRVRTIAQITGRLAGAPDAAARTARQAILAWFETKLRQELPAEAWEFKSFALDRVGETASVVALESPDYWALCYEHADHAVPGRRWSVEATVAVPPQGGRAQFGLRLRARLHPNDTDFEFRLPRFVRDIAAAPGLDDDGVALDETPLFIDDADGVADLVALLENPARRRPVHVVTLPNFQNDPRTAVIDTARLQRACLGVAHVAVLTSDAAFHLTDTIGRELSVFGGAVRTYRPGFTRTTTDPYAHPLSLMRTIETWGEQGPRDFEGFLIAQAFEESAARRDLDESLPRFVDVQKAALLLRHERIRKTDADARAQLAVLEERLANAIRDSEGWQALALEEEEKRRKIEDDLAARNAELHGCLARIAALEAQLAAGGRAAEEALPRALSEIPAWVERQMAGRLVLHRRAIRGLKDAAFADAELIARVLQLLAGPFRDARIKGGLERKSAFEDGLRAMHLEMSRSLSNGREGEAGDAYFVDYNGQRHKLALHIKNNANTRDPSRCLRIYFFWDDATQKVVVGSLPAHLPCRIS